MQILHDKVGVKKEIMGVLQDCKLIFKDQNDEELLRIRKEYLSTQEEIKKLTEKLVSLKKKEVRYKDKLKNKTKK